MFTDEDRKALQSAPVHVKFQVVCYENILPGRELDLARFTGPGSETVKAFGALSSPAFAAIAARPTGFNLNKSFFASLVEMASSVFVEVKLFV